MEKFDNSGVLFKAKEMKNDRSPQYTGNIMVNGVEYWLSGWVKESKNGQKFFGLAVSPKDAQQAPKKAAPKGVEFEDDSSIPF
jgi:hypothetical protein